MKKTSLLILFLISIGISQAQTNSIDSNACTINNIDYLGKNVSLLEQNIGPANSITDYFFEMDDVMSKLYKYDGVLFYVIENTIHSFEISSSDYSFTDQNIRVGDSINTLNTYYPKSYSNRKNSGVTISLKDIDRFIVFSYSNNTVEKIAIHTY